MNNVLVGETGNAGKPVLVEGLIELDVQISTAKKYPRNTEVALKEAAVMVTSSADIAASCNYSLPRKQNGKTIYITGPSIRLAEIFCQCWGNLHAATRILPSTDNKTIVAEAVAWDLEKNIKIVTQARRSICYKNGGTYSQDMQTVTANAAASIALRNAIFRVIPKAYAEKLHKLAINFAIDGQTGVKDPDKKLAHAVDKVVDYFLKGGYDESHILLFLKKGHRDEITREDIALLSGIKNRIDDGQIEISKSLPVKDSDFQEEEVDAVKEFLLEE
jgi:hypothetical protein